MTNVQHNLGKEHLMRMLVSKFMVKVRELHCAGAGDTHSAWWAQVSNLYHLQSQPDSSTEMKQSLNEKWMLKCQVGTAFGSEMKEILTECESYPLYKYLCSKKA